MVTLLLAIIYLAFISLGLPDSLLGSGWAVMHQDLNVNISYAGIITMIISAGTIVSSLLSDKLTRKFKTSFVTAFSVLLTAIALYLFSISNSFILLCLFAIPYGLGAGAIDAALNNYVALHFSSRHMSWLHCFWGVGTIISPYIMSFALTKNLGWQSGYKIVSLIQIILAIIIFISLPIWKNKKSDNQEILPNNLSFVEKLKIPGVFFVIIGFFAYCAAESTVMLWASTYLVKYRHINAEIAAAFASLFFIGITLGRFISGFVSEKLGDQKLIKIGSIIMIVGIILIALPFKNNLSSLAGLVIMGLGCAPIYPSIIHSTPYYFSKENSQAIIGILMASAYCGCTIIPLLFGIIVNYINIAILPLFLLFFAFLMILMLKMLNIKMRLIRNEKS